jgi:hypothetical protein
MFGVSQAGQMRTSFDSFQEKLRSVNGCPDTHIGLQVRVLATLPMPFYTVRFAA